MIFSGSADQKTSLPPSYGPVGWTRYKYPHTRMLSLKA